LPEPEEASSFCPMLGEFVILISGRRGGELHHPHLHAKIASGIFRFWLVFAYLLIYLSAFSAFGGWCQRSGQRVRCLIHQRRLTVWRLRWALCHSQTHGYRYSHSPGREFKDTTGHSTWTGEATRPRQRHHAPHPRVSSGWKSLTRRVDWTGASTCTGEKFGRGRGFNKVHRL